MGLEISRSSDEFFVSKKKYAFDLLKEFGVDSITPLKLPMDIHLCLNVNTGSFLTDLHPYQRLMTKLIYLTITCANIYFLVHILTQFMQHPTTYHMDAGIKLLRYIKSKILDKVYFLHPIQLFSRRTAIVTGRLVHFRDVPPLAIVSFLAPLQSHGKQRNNLL